MYARLIVSVLARIALFVLAGCLFWSSVPVLWGWKSTTVMSDSMAPSVRAGDIVVAMPVDDPTTLVGRVILFQDPDHADRLRLHRVVGTTAAGQLITRGDANGADDSSPVDPDAVYGTAVLRAPAIGLPFVWARSGRWELILLTTAAVVGLGVLAFRRSAAHRIETSRASRVAPSALSVVAALTVVSLVGSGATAHAAYTTQSPNSTSSLNAAAAYTCLSTPALDSPYLRYALNEGSGAVAVDSSGNGRNGTLLASVTREVGSCTGVNPSLALDGTITSGITVPGAAVTPPDTFSIEIWFRTTSTQGGQLIGFGSSASGTSAVADRRIWMHSNGSLRFSIRENNPIRTLNAGTYNDGAWHHAVATLSSSGMDLYVDGVLADSNNRSTGYHYDPYGSVGYWRVGGDTTTGMNGANTPTLASSIDNAAIYTTALTPAQVAAHYAAGR